MTDSALHSRTQLDAIDHSSGPGSRLRLSLAAVAFWTAIGLPALYLPLLLSGLGSLSDLAAFLGLFGLHVLALLAGQPYRAPPSR